MIYNIVYQRDSRTGAEYILVLNDDELGNFINAYDEGATDFYHDGKLNRLNRINEIAIFEISFFEVDSNNMEKAVKLAQMREIIPSVKSISTCFSGYGNKVTTKFIKGKWGWNKDKKNNMTENFEKKTGKIFISHCAKDKIVVNSFCELILDQGLEVNLRKDVFNTSLDGSKPISGEDFRNRIKAELTNAKLVIQFISKNYKESEVCLNEMGAAWVLNTDVVPVIIEEDKYEVGFIHSTDQQIQLSKKSDLLKLITDHKKTFTTEELNLPRLVEKAEQFLKILKEDSLNSKIQKVFPNTWTLDWDTNAGSKGTIKKMEIKEGNRLYENNVHRFDLSDVVIDESAGKVSFVKSEVGTGVKLINELDIVNLAFEYRGWENKTTDVLYKRIR